MSARPPGDPDQMRAVAKRLRLQSDRLLTQHATVRNAAVGMTFQVPAAVAFGARMVGVYAGTASARATLDEAAATLEREAAELRTAQAAHDAAQAKDRTRAAR